MKKKKHDVKTLRWETGSVADGHFYVYSKGSLSAGGSHDSSRQDRGAKLQSTKETHKPDGPSCLTLSRWKIFAPCLFVLYHQGRLQEKRRVHTRR